ncbi:unnamed protein product [Amoebophrya sp. A120]|nr:unnamed protein product [Amoebophrya sp. A120]|eukprot:GSA120T00019548001.1
MRDNLAEELLLFAASENVFSLAHAPPALLRDRELMQKIVAIQQENPLFARVGEREEPLCFVDRELRDDPTFLRAIFEDDDRWKQLLAQKRELSFFKCISEDLLRRDRRLVRDYVARLRAVANVPADALIEYDRSAESALGGSTSPDDRRRISSAAKEIGDKYILRPAPRRTSGA